jgi:N-acetylglucosamine kinase-like BadF-type ATPase
MILVVDSGSSKSDWKLELPDSPPLSFSTNGLNPFFVNDKEITRVIKEIPEIIPYANEITELYFYGAGCISPDRREMVSNALTPLFENAFISVENDLVGSALATCGTNKGYIATLGTGSDISFFDGLEVQPSNHGNGYVLGDEGSGAWFGKKLITLFLYGRLPKDLAENFAENYRITKEIVIKNVYQKERPNAYLASFAPFLSANITHPFIDEIVRSGFEEYVQTCILTYQDYQEYECHFVGSIAYYLDLILRDVCNGYHIKIGKILKSPINELFDFVIEREKSSLINF